jgi:hypothetical protein
MGRLNSLCQGFEDVDAGCCERSGNIPATIATNIPTAVSIRELREGVKQVNERGFLSHRGFTTTHQSLRKEVPN